jgi:uncharacterized protein (TIGR02246 family)
MKHRYVPLAIACLFTLAVHSDARASADESDVRAVVAQWEQAWNQHDMRALASLFTTDADFVNVGGRHWKGQEQIREQHQARINQFKSSIWTTKFVSVQFLEPDIALAHINWVLEGDTDPDGTARPARGGVFTWILTKSGTSWRIRAAQNTNLGNLAPHAPPGQPDPLPAQPPNTLLERTRDG